MHLTLALLLAAFHSGAGHMSVDMVGQMSDGSCTTAMESEVEGCLKPMLSYATTLQSNGLLPLEGMQIFEKLCSLYEEFQRCTGNLGCRSLSMTAMEASYGYMCGAGQTEFRKHVNCFAEVEGLEQYLGCKTMATESVNELAFDATKPDAYFARLCSVMQQYLHCSRPVINSSCGRDAWDLVTRVTRDSLKVTMPQCDLQPYLENKPEKNEV